jgi:hypothetical protein
MVVVERRRQRNREVVAEGKGRVGSGVWRRGAAVTMSDGLALMVVTVEVVL